MNQENQQPLLGHYCHESTSDHGSRGGHVPTTNSMTTGETRGSAFSLSQQYHRSDVLMDDEDDYIGSEEEDDDDDDDDDEVTVLGSSSSRACEYTRPFVVLDVIWNLSFVIVSLFALITTVKERPSSPLRLWISGYALQSLSHVGFVWIEYRRRSFNHLGGSSAHHLFGVPSFPLSSSSIKILASTNPVISSIWWVFGFYWIVMGGEALLQDSPHLYWLSVVFLAFDVFFMIFCIAMATIFLLARFCCWPILATAVYAMTIREGATEKEIRTLPRYRYRQWDTLHNPVKQGFGVRGNLNRNSSADELVLHVEDSECCICLYEYEEGVELCSLPCNHHFHFGCISRWLRINATCPLCKKNILRGELLV